MANSNKDYFTEMVKLVLGMGVVAIVIVLAIRMVIGAFSSTNEMDQSAINDRLKAIDTVSLVGEVIPTAKVAAAPAKVEKAPAKAAPAKEVAAPAKAASDSASIDGGAIYKIKCAVCHAAGVAGAPIFGNKEQWAARIAKGMDALYDTALNGSKVNPAMLPKGGSADLSDAQVKAIVEYMVAAGSK
ncbi:MAG: c-type cytochrome [Pseudomonadota bacterium]